MNTRAIGINFNEKCPAGYDRKGLISNLCWPILGPGVKCPKLIDVPAGQGQYKTWTAKVHTKANGTRLCVSNTLITVAATSGGKGTARPVSGGITANVQTLAAGIHGNSPQLVATPPQVLATDSGAVVPGITSSRDPEPVGMSTGAKVTAGLLGGLLVVGAFYAATR